MHSDHHQGMDSDFGPDDPTMMALLRLADCALAVAIDEEAEKPRRGFAYVPEAACDAVDAALRMPWCFVGFIRLSDG